MKRISTIALSMLLFISVFGINAATSKVRAEEPVTSPNKPFDICKDGGWKTMKDKNGQPFKNQGQCVSSFAKTQHTTPTP